MCKGDRAGGRWTVTESNCHVNELETPAAFFALKSFCHSMTNCHINIYIDNTTAVSYINAMGGTHSLECNKIAREIWTWCIQRNIWVTAISLPGKENVDADRESRTFNDNTVWSLNENIFHSIVETYGMPSIDLFLHLELTEKFPVMCHGGQTLRHNLWMLSLALGLKKNFMLSLLLA